VFIQFNIHLSRENYNCTKRVHYWFKGLQLYWCWLWGNYIFWPNP